MKQLHEILRAFIKTLQYKRRFFDMSNTVGCGPGSSVGIATDYGLDGPVSNPGGDKNFRPSGPALGPTQPTLKWVLSLSRG
jgi:hypothetical protein